MPPIKAWLPAVKANTGADVFTRRLAAGLRDVGVECTISWLPHWFEAAPSMMFNVEAPSGTNIVHANSLHAYALRRQGAALVATIHHVRFCKEVVNSTPYHKRLYQRVLKRHEVRSLDDADAVTAVGYSAAECARQWAGRDDIVHVPNWVDTERFSPSPVGMRDSMGHLGQRRQFRLLFIGDCSFMKGADILQPLMDALGADYHMAFAGRLRGGVRFGGTNISVLGRLEESDVIAAMRACDALIVPSRAESFGYVAAEAMSCGKPVIASDTTGLKELVVDGVTGILCKPGDTGAFVSACRTLAESPTKCADFGRAGRERIIKGYSAAVAIPRYLEIYEELVQRLR